MIFSGLPGVHIWNPLLPSRDVFCLRQHVLGMRATKDDQVILLCVKPLPPCSNYVIL